MKPLVFEVSLRESAIYFGGVHSEDDIGELVDLGVNSLNAHSAPLNVLNLFSAVYYRRQTSCLSLNGRPDPLAPERNRKTSTGLLTAMTILI